ncbi:NHL repeat-containing protein [Aeromicrobium wangtongii]|uniref:Superoxide dismutase n=1 Tax=Aeromicrobium wangtongii TaxID=2969247 RepID=A0ABY5MBV9_9ACTN|nr:superoxide dismutase [Aeromicrobium wangtongii]MCD9197144.1 superoxide dismutase [Aeromicrobium wangtongii]UUP14641.1 superoxide dismutase [Aeromicrobium wangtongii]
MRQFRWAVGLAVMIMAGSVLPASAHHDHDRRPAQPDRIELPNGWLPEGITTDGKNLYSGSRADGAIVKIAIRSGRTTRFAGAAGRVAVGIDYDRRRDVLWVAGGAGKQVRAQDADTGKVLATYAFPSAGARFVNDLTVTRTGVYATDSLSKELLVIPFGHGRSAKLPAAGRARIVPLTGDLQLAEGNNLNGIVSYGRSLVAVQSNTGLLLRIDPRSGRTRQVDTGGTTFVNGDGLERGRGVLYVVQNRFNKIAVVDLDRRQRTGELVDTIERSDFADEIDVPSTVALVHRSLFVVNARFGIASPGTAAYWITRADARR